MVFNISNSFFYSQKVAYFVFNDSSSPVKASNFKLLNPDLLMLYRRPFEAGSGNQAYRSGVGPKLSVVSVVV